MQLEHNLELQG